jgi:DOPA 4,5-dioxygenase
VAYVSSAPRGEIGDNEIGAYHFHTYFFQKNDMNSDQALKLRVRILDEIENGDLKDCSLNIVNYGPRGPHPIGSYETCCNRTSITSGISWFMSNRGNLSILLHPLTRFEVDDHTARAMWLGQSMPLDLSALSPILPEPPTCPHYNVSQMMGH